MLYYVTLCYIMLRMLCYVSYVISCYVCYVMLRKDDKQIKRSKTRQIAIN